VAQGVGHDLKSHYQKKKKKKEKKRKYLLQKRAGKVAQVVECLCSKYKALGAKKMIIITITYYYHFETRYHNIAQADFKFAMLSAFQVLGLQMCTTTPSKNDYFISRINILLVE
jgi:ribosomal protein S8E